MPADLRAEMEAAGLVPMDFDPACPVERITPHPRNVNEGDVGAICTSIDALGFYGAVLAQQSTGLIIAGKHRYLAAIHQGLDTVPVLWLDVDDDRALRIMLADNQVTRAGRDNERALLDILARLNTTPTGLTATGYDTDDLDDLLTRLEPDPSGIEWKEYDESAADGLDTVRCPACHEEFLRP